MQGLPGRRLNPTAGDFWREEIRSKRMKPELAQRLVIIEFESLERALAAYDSPEYQAALDILRNSAERDVRII
jgi:uncharacterized protein (DUF1330 family)